VFQTAMMLQGTFDADTVEASTSESATAVDAHPTQSLERKCEACETGESDVDRLRLDFLSQDSVETIFQAPGGTCKIEMDALPFADLSLTGRSMEQYGIGDEYLLRRRVIGHLKLMSMPKRFRPQSRLVESELDDERDEDMESPLRVIPGAENRLADTANIFCLWSRESRAAGLQARRTR